MLIGYIYASYTYTHTCTHTYTHTPTYTHTFSCPFCISQVRKALAFPLSLFPSPFSDFSLICCGIWKKKVGVLLKVERLSLEPGPEPEPSSAQAYADPRFSAAHWGRFMRRGHAQMVFISKKKKKKIVATEATQGFCHFTPRLPTFPPPLLQP